MYSFLGLNFKQHSCSIFFPFGKILFFLWFVVKKPCNCMQSHSSFCCFWWFFTIDIPLALHTWQWPFAGHGPIQEGGTCWGTKHSCLPFRNLWAEFSTITWPSVMWYFQGLVLLLFGSRHRSERNPFLSFPLFEKHVCATSLLRTFPTPFNCGYSALLVVWNLFMVWDIYHVLQLCVNICI